MLVGQHNQIATGVHWLLDGHIACPMPATVGWEMLVWRFWNTLSAVSNNLAGVHWCSVAPKFNNTQATNGQMIVSVTQTLADSLLEHVPKGAPPRRQEQSSGRRRRHLRRLLFLAGVRLRLPCLSERWQCIWRGSWPRLWRGRRLLLWPCPLWRCRFSGSRS